jgi:hypothetical protein
VNVSTVSNKIFSIARTSTRESTTASTS